eukprot:s497_g38.t1
MGSQARERATAVQAAEQVGRIQQEAQTEVNRVQAEAQRIVAQASEHVGQVQHSAEERVIHAHTEAQRIVLENELRTQQTVASTQVSAAQALYEQDRRLRDEFWEREKELMKEVQQLRQQLFSTTSQSESQLRQNDTDLRMRVDLVVAQLTTLQDHVMDLAQRVQAIENWGQEDHATYEVEDELVPGAHVDSPPVITFASDQPRLSSPLLRNVGGSPRRYPPPLSPVAQPVVQGIIQEDEEVQAPEENLRWKDVSAIRMPPLPDSAGAFRAWRNAFLPMLMALDSSNENLLYQWLLQAFNAKSVQEVQHLRDESDGFPRFDRILCSWFTKESCLKGHFGTRIQAHIEESIANNRTLRGRPLLNLVVREFDLDAALGGVVSAVELFQLQSPESDLASLIHFRDKVRYILGQLPLYERPQENLMSKWLYERLKRVKQLQLVIERIKESPAMSHERTYDYLWSRLERVIAESQHERNLSSIQEGLKKGPKKIGAPAGPQDPRPKAKGKGDAKGKKGGGKDSQGKGKGDNKTGKGKSDGKGKGGSKSNQGDSKGTSNQGSVPKGVCLFWPKGLCRRGADCPYKHEGPSVSGAAASSSTQAKASSSVPKASTATKAAVAIVAASHVLGTSASVADSCTAHRSFELEWALDSGAGEDLSSVGAFCNQGVPAEWVESFSTVSSSPLTFETGGGAKASTNTVGFVGDKAGEGMVYMLKNCPYVRSLGKLIQKGFSFFWGPDHEPTLVPPDVPFNVSCETSQCHVAERVDHCVPIFRETISFTYGMPAASSSVEPSSLPAFDAEAPRGDSVGVVVDGNETPNIDGEVRLVPDDVLLNPPEGPIGGDMHQSKDSAGSINPAPDPDSSKFESKNPKVPVDHLLTHLPSHPNCDVCREAKLRAKAHRRFPNQNSSIREARIIEAPTKFLQRVCVDHLESAELSFRGEQYALVCVDQFTGAFMAYPSKSKSQSAVELALRHFIGDHGKPIVVSDRYPSILAAIKAIGCVPDPTPPNADVKNPLAESSINIIRQGTRALLLQAGLDVQHWPRAMLCFCYQYDLNTPPSNHEGSLRHQAHQHAHELPPGVEGPEVPFPQVDSKLHLALGYQPEPRLLPFGCFVWYLGRIKDPAAPKSFSPNGKPAIYLSPEVSPGLKSKDVHLLLDLSLLTSTGQIREIITRDFVEPSGSWVFPLTRVTMLKPLDPQLPPRDVSAVVQDDDAHASPQVRNRSITKRRIERFGQTDLCDGCINGTYQHTQACRQRFNRLLDASEPLPRGEDALVGDRLDGRLDENEAAEDRIDDIFRLFDTVTPTDVEPVDPLDKDLVPECPPNKDDESEGYSPSLAPSDDESETSSPESYFDEDVIGEVVVRAPGGVVMRQSKNILIEFCCKEGSSMSKVAELVGVTYLGISKESFDVENDDHFEQVMCWVQEEIQHGCTVHLWAAIPGTAWSPWQKMALHRYEGYAEKLKEKRRRSLNLVSKFHELAQLVGLSRGGSVSFKWSKDSEGWEEPEVQACMSSLGMKTVQFDGCSFDLEIDGKKPKRKWIVKTTNDRIIRELESKKCHHEKGYHDQPVGSFTKKAGFYNMNMAICLVSTLFPGVVLDRIPALPVCPFKLDPHRARLQDIHTPDICVLATIHKLLSRDEMRKDPRAIQAIKDEGKGVRAKEVWIDESVMEKADRIALAKKENKTIHVAEVMPIASIKHWEHPERRKYKGRLVFRGDQVKDTWGGAAQFGELYSTPTNIQAINLAIFFGMLAGHAISTADCTRAFLQALLLMDEETYVVLPRELWLPSWFGKFHQPTVRLRKALYGHPLASAFWDRHLRHVLIDKLGLVCVEGHPSVFRCPRTNLLVVVYVDDVLVSGPEKEHDQFWASLRQHVEIDEVESLNQFIGRDHILGDDHCIFDMSDYCQQAVDLYIDAVGGMVTLRNVGTPYVNESMLTQHDYEVEGQVSNKSSSVLMKLLWLCRLARPDLAYAISSLATQVTRWSRNADKQLFRTFEERDAMNQAIVHSVNVAAHAWGIEVLRYEIRDIIPPASIKQAMEMEAEAERRRRAEVLQSEGDRQSEVNLAQGKMQAAIHQAKGIELISAAIASNAGGHQAATLRVAEQWVAAWKEMARKSNTIIVPANAGDASSMIASATSIMKQLGDGSGPLGPDLSGPLPPAEASQSAFNKDDDGMTQKKVLTWGETTLHKPYRGGKEELAKKNREAQEKATELLKDLSEKVNRAEELLEQLSASTEQLNPEKEMKLEIVTKAANSMDGKADEASEALKICQDFMREHASDMRAGAVKPPGATEDDTPTLHSIIQRMSEAQKKKDPQLKPESSRKYIRPLDLPRLVLAPAAQFS